MKRRASSAPFEQGLTRHGQPGGAQHLLHAVLLAEVERHGLAHALHTQAIPGGAQGHLHLLQEADEPVYAAELTLKVAPGLDELVGVEAVAHLVMPDDAPADGLGHPLQGVVADQRYLGAGEVEEAQQRPMGVAGEVGRDKDDVHGG
jgi:hypothetical protein